MPVKTFELWHSPSKGAYTMMEARLVRRSAWVFEPDAVLVHKFKAASNNAALRERNRFLGWK